MTIWFSSDLHLGHDKDFIYKPRGFVSAQENAETIFENFNKVLQANDDLYLLGDLLVGTDSDNYFEYLASFPSKLHLLWGNHDSNRRKEMFQKLPNLVETLGYGTTFQYGKWHFLLSHYPTLTANYDDYDKPLKRRIWNLYGHTHSKNKFELMSRGWQSYNVGVDAHNCYPISINDIIEEIKYYYLQLFYDNNEFKF